MSDSTGPGRRVKPAKPSEDFPLFPHATGRWAKKVGGKTLYFGRWEDPAGALAAYHDYLAGIPSTPAAGDTLAPATADTLTPALDTPAQPPVAAAKGNGRPAKPYLEFPLFAHASGRWAKKIRGKLHYFGPWSDPTAALNKYLDQKDDLHAGRTPRPHADAFVVRDLLNHFLTSKKHLADAGEITQRTYDEYYATCERLGEAFGLTRLVDDLAAADFEALRGQLAKRWGPVVLGNEVQRIRTVFKYACEVGLIEHPVRFGPGFKRPSRRVLRKARHEKLPRMFEAEELRKLLEAAGVQLRAMVLLGVNAGFGNADCGTVPRSALDLDRGWVSYPRPKTGIPRRAPLWPETVAAIREALSKRPTPKEAEDADLVFVTKYGHRWHTGTVSNPLSHEIAKLLRGLGIWRQGLNFYALRHTFETIGGDTGDQVAVDHIMGHVRDDMASIYRERIADERLKKVTDHVRAWLWPPPPQNQKQKRGRGSKKQLSPEGASPPASGGQSGH